MNKNELRQHITETLLEIAPDVEIAKLDPAVSFRDQFEIDSVDFLNFVLALEKRLGIKISEIDYPKLSSVRGCLSYLAMESGEDPKVS